MLWRSHEKGLQTLQVLQPKDLLGSCQASSYTHKTATHQIEKMGRQTQAQTQTPGLNYVACQYEHFEMLLT